MTGKSPGRELAIETLIDMEENGAFYRASRVLEEAVPNAISSRANLVTRSALVEQAHSLQKYEIDTVRKYNTVFLLDDDKEAEESKDTTTTTTSSSLTVKRILEHATKLDKSVVKVAPPQLVSALRNVCPSDYAIRSLLRAIMTHRAMEEQLQTSQQQQQQQLYGDDEQQQHHDNAQDKNHCNLETYIANVCRMAVTSSSSSSSNKEEDDEVLHGLLISCLSILMGSILSTEEEEDDDEDDGVKGGSLKKTGVSTTRGDYLDPVMPSLQVGSVLSLLKYSSRNEPAKGGGGCFRLDQDILDYLGRAASVHEERIEMKRSRMKQQTISEQDKEAADDRALSPIPIAPLTPTDNADNGQQEQEEQGLESPAEFEEEEDESDSDSTDDSGERYNPEDVQGLVRHGMGHDDVDDDEMHQVDDSSSSSSGSEGDPQHVELVDEDDQDEDDEENDSEDDEEDDFDEESDIEEEDEMLREALALSLVDQGPAFDHVPNDNNDEQQQETVEEGVEEESSNQTENRFATPPPEQSKPDTVPCLEENESCLPPLPSPPPHYPYATLLDSFGDIIDMDRNETKTTSSLERERSEYLDPTQFSKFGSVPSSHALVHLLHYTINVIQQRRRGISEEDAIRSVPGGMGSSLFEAAVVPSASDTKNDRNEDSDSAISLQLLISIFLLFDQNRKHAIENLRHAISTEQRNLQGEDESDDEQDSPLSAEEDPALALAMNYVEDDVYLEEDVPSDTGQSNMSESLENKGMRRKAAAAAHDVAARLKSLRKQTEAWRNRVKLLSLCTLMSMKCLREYLRSTVLLWLQRSSLPMTNTMSDFACVLDFEKLMPSTTVARLSDSLNSLMSIESFRSYASLLSGDEGADIEDVFFPLQLYRGALSTWGDCLPLLHPSDRARSDLLSSTMEGYVAVASAAGSAAASDLDTLDVLPSLDSEVQLHKLVILTRRLRVSDLLDGLVGRPIQYSADNCKPKSDLFGEVDVGPKEPPQFSKVIKLVGSAAASCPQQARRDLQRLYLALCHRCHVQVLLWDRLSVSSEAEADGIAASTSAGTVADIVRVSPNPSSTLQFDTSKCSDSIAILSNHSNSPSAASGSSAHQRASKVWGAVLSSSFFSPKTGVHRWAVRLDKCERGHVFVGVATSQASTRTYVGGDKFGWGVIGTQALWHDRRKIRGDYGATFRTGSTIIVSLDTDAGTLSFSSWKDSNTSSASFSLDPSLQSIASPSRRIAGGGTVEDWGVAFEGLPLDSRLYPAVGMYQRDDRVTLLNVESGGRSSGPDGVIGSVLAAGSHYYPRVTRVMVDGKTDICRVAQVKRHNDILSWDGIQYVSDLLRSLSEQLGSSDDDPNDLLCSVLPSICAALSLLPSSVPMISQRFGVMILPHLTRCIQELHLATKTGQTVFSNGLQDGKWVIRATGAADTSSVAECEEYVVDFENSNGAGDVPPGIHGSGVGTTGKSKNGLVSIFGTATGSALHFIEEWTDGKEESTRSSDSATSSCVVTARTNLDGTRFEGTYVNVQYGTSGQISGVLRDPLLPEEDAKDLTDVLLQCEALLCLAQGHLANVLAEDISDDHTCEAGAFKPSQVAADLWQDHCSTLKGWVSSSLLSGGVIDTDSTVLSQSLDELRQLYTSPLSADTPSALKDEGILGPDFVAGMLSSADQCLNLASLIDTIEGRLWIGKEGSFASLCPHEYTVARRKVLCALILHGNLSESLVNVTELSEGVKGVSEDLLSVGRCSLRILEDCIRSALSSPQDDRRTRKEIAAGACRNINCISEFLLRVAPDVESSIALADKINDAKCFYASVGNEEDLFYIQAEMKSSTKRALLRMSALKQIAVVLDSIEGTQKIPEDAVAVECVASVLPRLMGRSWVKADRRGTEDLGGYYLAMLSGAVHVPTESIRAAVFDIYGSLGRLLGRYSSDKAIVNSSRYSLMLSLLSAYIVTIRSADVSAVISDSSLFELLSVILGENRDAVRTSPVEFTSSDDRSAAVEAIYGIVVRDASRSVVHAVTSITHVLAFQLSHFSACGALRTQFAESSLKDCLKLIIREFGVLIPFIESTRQLECCERSKNVAFDDWERWCGVCLSGGHLTSTKGAGDTSTRNRGGAGISYLNDYGVGSVLCGKHVAMQKATSRTDTLALAERSTATSEYFAVLSLCSQQYLSHWLNIVSCLCKSQTSLRIMAGDDMWPDDLLSAAGLSCVRDENGALASAYPRKKTDSYLLPARYRARILRLVRNLLVLTNPSEKLVEGLIVLGGSSTVLGNHNDNSEGSVTREIVSLLRHLHLPSFPHWRNCVMGFIAHHFISPDGQDVSKDLAIGFRLFLGGSTKSLVRGAYVLLKPPAAARLSPDAQVAPSSKSHGSSGSSGPSSGVGVSPHHLAGNGTEGIVSGICRADAAAGIVSSMLIKNGACEVILMNRHGLPSSDTRNESRYSRHSLTVRAVRTPLADVALAEEIPLFLDQSIDAQGFLGVALSSSLDQMQNEAKCASSVRSGEVESMTRDEKHDYTVADENKNCSDFTAALTTIRSAIAVSSRKEILMNFLRTDVSSKTFSRLLSMAFDGDGKFKDSGVNDGLEAESLSELPKHEAQYSHLHAMLREVAAREEVLKSIPASLWESKLAEQRRVREEAGVTEEDTEVNEDSAGIESDARPSSTTTAARNFGDEEARRSESSRVISQSTVSTNNSTDEDEEGEAAATAAAHLREAAIAQMAELGLPRSWSELALRRTGGTNIEAAVHFCLERGGDMERLIAEEQERDLLMQRQPGGASSRRRSSRGDNQNHLLRQLLEMGFPRRWCAEALAATGNNVDEALTWILTNGERLSAEDLGMEEEMDDGEDIDEDEDSVEEEGEEGLQGLAAQGEPGEGNEEQVGTSSGRGVAESTPRLSDSAGIDGAEIHSEPVASGWSGPVCPLRFISGRSIIDSKKLSVSGLPSGGFSSVGTRGILLTTGKWYYEAVLETAGCLQIGWADGSFSGHCNADRGDGCGDGPSSWAFDGWRRYRWHASATEWGCRWKEGDVIGCLVDLDERIVSFTLNGQGEEIGMGVAFSGEGFRPCGGVYACVSFNRSEKLNLILGGKCNEAFKHQPPPGYKGVGEAVVNAVDELDSLLAKESILLPSSAPAQDDGSVKSKRFLCDFSDGEHGHELFAWQHRYYGSDASVHLGSARHSKQLSESQKTGSGLPFSAERSAFLSVSRRVEKAWKEQEKISDRELTDEDPCCRDSSRFATMIMDGYAKVAEKLESELRSESVALGILYCRKLILHIMVTLGKDFDLDYFVPNDTTNRSEGELISAQRLWSVLDACVSLRSAGWVGEAGAMAVAAEALGLGISSAQSRHSSSDARSGVHLMAESDDCANLPSAGITQMLSTVLVVSSEISTGSSLAACAEAAIGSGGSLIFLRPSLQSVVCRSQVFQDLLVAVVRRAVRLLAVVDYSGEDSCSTEDPEDEDTDGSSFGLDGSQRLRGEDNSGYDEQPDARLTLFVTGLLLSCASRLTPERERYIMVSLFEAWSVGLLSSSMPWRMVCALSAAGILNSSPEALPQVINSLPTVSQFYARLHSTVARRIWAERAATPVCSRYVEALTELLASVRRAVEHSKTPLIAKRLSVDAATPVSFNGTTRLLELPSSGLSNAPDSSWEWDDGWLSCDAGWEVWTGSVKCMAVDWKAPSRSAVRTLMDGGEGPPMLRPGCKVMRGLDWEDDGSGSINGNEDGKDVYEVEKAKREKEKQSMQEEKPDSQPQAASVRSGSSQNDAVADSDPTTEGPSDGSTARPPSPEQETTQSDTSKVHPPPGEQKQKRRKVPSPKLPVGTVLSIEPWKGMPAMARRVKWDLTDIEGLYRFGGDGGRFDICHVEVNKKSTRIRKRHPLPESAEQCASRHGFGVERTHSVLLRLRRTGDKKLVDGDIEFHHQGILEWPDFGAAARVFCVLHSDGAVSVTEKELLYGSKDAGWEARFGQPAYVAGTVMVLSPARSLEDQSELDASSSFLSLYEELLGSSSTTVDALRDRATGGKVRITSEMRLLRSKHPVGDSLQALSTIQAPVPPPILFDSKLHASSISLSRDHRTITCVAPDGRGTAYASTGFTKGVHYWEVKLEQADVGSVFVGVAEKPTAGGSGGSPYGQESQPRLNRWHGWGFVNFRATYTAGAERVYGAHCHAGDTVGVLLDCDAGRVSFFFDGLKYGEHILNDLGCAFENLSPFGFNADGCGSGGAGQGAPSGVEGGRGGRYPAQGSVRPRALWPVVGLRNPGDRVTISTKWMTSTGIDGPLALKNILAVDELLASYDTTVSKSTQKGKLELLPSWFLMEAFCEYERWRCGRWLHSPTRGSGPHRMAGFGLDVHLDTSPLACASACACLGLKQVLLPRDRVMVKRSAGRMLELPEEAIILGAYQGRLYYRLVSQKSEGGSLTEGGGRAWFWDESEVVDDGIELVGDGKGLGIPLPMLDRFTCLSTGGLKIVYEGGAVVRSDLEIFDGSVNIGTIPLNTIIPRDDVLERRVNSCGVVRYRIRHEEISNGWISAWIRGGKEEAIVEPVLHVSDGKDISCKETGAYKSYSTPLECAQVWHEEYAKKNMASDGMDEFAIKDIDDFRTILSQGVIRGLSLVESDMLLVSVVGAIADFSDCGDAVDCSFSDIAGPLALAVSSARGNRFFPPASWTASPGANQAALTMLSDVNVELPEVKALLARTAVLRAFNRRARAALPWLSVRPSQEGNAILGGLSGHGASIDRVGHYVTSESLDEWVHVPSIASRVRCLRRLFFTCIKRSFLESIMECTTTPTPLSHDEYELPREIRTVRINRLKARRAMAGSDTRIKRKHSAFSQLQSETRSWGGAALRRGFVAKGHGGQKRAFKIKLIGEGVNDYSGPYREVFTDAMNEALEVDEDGRGVLGVLDATPNNASQIGDNRELVMFSTGDRDLSNINSSGIDITDEEARIRNSYTSLTMARDEASREVEESLVCLGRLVGTACRHGIPVDLPLPLHSVWKAIAEESSNQMDCIRELDLLASRQHAEANEDGKEPMILQWQRRMLNSFMDGLSNVFPCEILTLMTGEEIRDVFCGNGDIDVDLLRRVAEYEGYDEDDDVIQYFWEALREMDDNERKKFLQFVWARNRLPTKESAFDAPFKIQKDAASAGSSADAALPSASTCFFSLTLPEYSSKEILTRKLLFAIDNVVTMESDYVTNDAEVGEGWRGL